MHYRRFFRKSEGLADPLAALKPARGVLLGIMLGAVAWAVFLAWLLL